MQESRTGGGESCKHVAVSDAQSFFFADASGRTRDDAAQHDMRPASRVHQDFHDRVVATSRQIGHNVHAAVRPFDRPMRTHRGHISNWRQIPTSGAGRIMVAGPLWGCWDAAAAGSLAGDLRGLGGGCIVRPLPAVRVGDTGGESHPLCRQQESIGGRSKAAVDAACLRCSMSSAAAEA